MAAAYQTKTDSGGSLVGGSTNVVVGKPSGTVDGDLVIVVFAVAGTNPVTGAPDGSWTALTMGSGSGAPTLSGWYKIASGEGASWTFTRGGTNVNMHWCAMRWSGHAAVTPIPASNGGAAGNTSNPSIAGGVTPTVANSILLAVWGSAQDTGGHSGYAVATDNPGSWNEILDFTSSSVGFAIAYGERAATSATGNVSMTSSDSDNTNDNSVGLIAISPAISGPANVKTIQGVAKASVKTVQGVAIASIKTLQGVA